ncbi:MAG: type II toxin-antitoxin system VapC family toxin [Mariprofundaceae bacterium]|nr:type II toxin-antitoxin system VapC family toxin [Mariprofundaceae bacterium]
MKALFDTNILIDYLNGIEAARDELALYDKPSISSITWMKVLAGAFSEEEEIKLRAFLSRFTVLSVNMDVSEKAVELRRQYRMHLPDTIIWATAMCDSALLVSRNTRDFPSGHPGVRLPYHLSP